MRTRTMLILTLAALPLAAQVPVDQLSKPPANAQAFTVLSTAGTNGHSYAWTTSDGTRMCRESILLRGMVTEVDEAIVLGASGTPVSDTVRGSTPQGDAAETFTVKNGLATWKSQVDAGTHSFGDAYYATAGGSMCSSTVFLPAVLHAPSHTLNLLPGGTVKAERLTDLKVGHDSSARTVSTLR